MSDETDGVETTENAEGVNGAAEVQEDGADASVPADSRPAKLDNNNFKNELNESDIRKEIIPAQSPRHAIRVKRELVSFDISASARNDAAEAEKQQNLMVEFPNDWTCINCGFGFSTLEDLQAHQPDCRYSVSRAHICEICQESFERKSDLNNHIVCHQVNRPHACRMCGSLFRKKADLLSHMVTHQVDKPHKCGTCGLEFQRHSSLTNHMKIHTYAAGRALIPTIYSQTKPMATSTQATRPVVMTGPVIKRVQSTWQAPQRSTDPIPSFETLPAPGYSYFNNLAASSNFSSFLANKAIGNAGPSPKHGSPGINPSLLPAVHAQNPFPTSASATQITCLPDITQGSDAETHGDLPTDFQIPQQPFAVDEQSEFDNVPEVENNESENQTLSSYLTVKNAGLLYGIKVEGTYNQQELNSQQSIESPEQQTLVESQPEDNVVQQMQEAQQDEASPTSPPVPQTSTSSRAALSEAPKPHMCQFCGIYFARLKAYQSHMRVHDDNYEPTYQCPVCGQNFPDYVALSLHTTKCMRGSRRDDDYNVNEEELESPSNATLPAARQSTVNRQQFKHVCATCDKRFATKQKLFRHMWIHRRKLFTCESCGENFNERELLDRHRLELHPPNESTPYACQTCGKSFTSRQTLWEHGRVHGGTGAGAALLWCQECNKSFASRQGYQIHTRTHTGERPYGCRYCMKSFRDGGTLRKHERIHTGERPHVCPLCMRAFNQKVVLREHVRWVHAATATGESSLRCVLCGTSVPDREALCAHIVKHSDEMASEARAATKSNNNLKPRRPPRKSNKILVQAVDGKFVSVEKDELDLVSNTTVETVPPPASRGQPTATVTSDSMDDSSHSTPESPFSFPKMEPQSSDMPSTSSMDCSEPFVYANDEQANMTSPVAPAGEPQSPENTVERQSSPGEKINENPIPIPGFSEIVPPSTQSIPVEEPAPNVTVADIPNSQYHFMNPDVNLPPATMETDMDDPMAYIQVVTDISSNPQDVMSQLNLVPEESDGAKESGERPREESYFEQGGDERKFPQDGTVGLANGTKDDSGHVKCEICHEEFSDTEILIEHVNSHV